jgi:hypothetical protein
MFEFQCEYSLQDYVTVCDKVKSRGSWIYRKSVLAIFRRAYEVPSRSICSKPVSTLEEEGSRKMEMQLETI